MTRLLAVEWDHREARLAVATAVRGGARIEELVAVPLVADDGQTELSDAEIARRIAAFVAERKLGRVETLVAVARASIELKRLTLPPAPDEELPELVRFQALREFTNLGEDWPLDFVPLSGSATEPRAVLAAAIAPAALKEILAVCESAEIEPRHVVLRPCAAAALLRRRPAAHRVRLLIDVLVDEADLTVLVGETVVFMRTARLSHGLTEAEHTAALVAEVRRTLAAVTNQLSGERVEQVLVGGTGPRAEALAAATSDQLRLPAVVFDPLDGLDLAGDLERRPPQDAGRFAPLVGMLLEEAAGAPHAIDFLAPKKRPAPPSRRRQYITAGAAAAAVALSLAAWVWTDLGARDAENAGLAATAKANEALVKDAEAAEKDLQELEKWLAGDVSWIDELARASAKMPPPEEVIVTNLAITSDTRGPAMAIAGAAKSDATIDRAQDSLRDDKHRVETNDISPDNSLPGFERKFASTVKVGDPPAAAPKGPRQRGARSAPGRP